MLLTVCVSVYLFVIYFMFANIDNRTLYEHGTAGIGILGVCGQYLNHVAG